MRTNLSNKLLEKIRAEKMTQKLGGRPSTGAFQIRGNDSHWYWANVAVSSQDANILAAEAAKIGVPETKFAGALVEEFLHTHVSNRTISDVEYRAQGLKFSGNRDLSPNVWLSLGLTEELARDARIFRSSNPELLEATDYQLISEVLKRATVDYVDASTLPSDIDEGMIEYLEDAPGECILAPENMPQTVDSRVEIAHADSPDATDTLQISQQEPAQAQQKAPSKFLPGFARRAGEKAKIRPNPKADLL